MTNFKALGSLTYCQPRFQERFSPEQGEALSEIARHASYAERMLEKSSRICERFLEDTRNDLEDRSQIQQRLAPAASVMKSIADSAEELLYLLQMIEEPEEENS